MGVFVHVPLEDKMQTRSPALRLSRCKDTEGTEVQYNTLKAGFCDSEKVSMAAGFSSILMLAR